MDKNSNLYFILLSLTCLLAGCDQTESSEIEDNDRCADCNIIILSATNVRADHLGFAGYERATSPYLDELAQKSLVFENAFSQASWTLPMGLSIFTSTYPFTHGVMNRNSGRQILSGDLVTLPEILRDHGYATAAFTGGFDYHEQYGLISRFDHTSFSNTADEYDPNHPESEYGLLKPNLDKVLTWLDEHQNDTFLLFYQGFDAHCPYALPRYNDMFDPDYERDVDFTRCLWTFGKSESVTIGGETYYNLMTPANAEFGYDTVLLGARDVDHMMALYDGEIRDVDSTFGRVLKRLEDLGLEQNTIIVVLSEHGDMFGKHGRFMRGGPLRGTFYDDVLHVPLVIKHPTLQHQQIDGIAQLIDIVPTLLDFLDIPLHEQFEGKSLLPVIKGEQVHEFATAGAAYTPPRDNFFFNQTSIIVSARTLGHKMIRERLFSEDNSYNDSYEFYDMQNDPEELQDIHDSASPELILKFSKRLKEMDDRFETGMVIN